MSQVEKRLARKPKPSKKPRSASFAPANFGKLASEAVEQEGKAHDARSSKMVNSESRVSACATSVAALFMSANAPRFDAVAANAIVGLH
jgi:hypothetical protein